MSHDISHMTQIRRVATGTLWMALCVASFIAMAVASRELSDTLSVFQILFYRSVVGVVIVAVFARRFVPHLRRGGQFGMHLLRNTVHFGSQYCWTLGIALLPLAEVVALEFTMPVWVAIFAALFLGERISRARFAAIGASFVGVLIILQPGAEVFDPAAFVVLAAACGYGLSIVMVKFLAREDAPAMIVVWMVLLQLPMGLAFALFDWRPTVWGDLPWIVIAGVTGMSAHYTMAQALRLLDASFALPIDFFRVPLIAAVGFVLYDETVDIWLLIGAVMIFGANFASTRHDLRAR